MRIPASPSSRLRFLAGACAALAPHAALTAQTPTWLDVSPLTLIGTAVYHPDRGVTVLVDAVQNRLWEWNGTTFRRVVGVAPSTTNPGPAAWDPTNHRAVFGRGFAWDGANWHNLPMPIGVSQFGGLAVDAVRDRIVGLSGTNVYEWDGAAWTRIVPPASPGEGYAFVFDPQRGRCVLAANQPPALFDWDGAQWNVVDASLPLQHANFTASLVHDPIHGRLVLHGTSPVAGSPPATWQYQNGAWQSIATPSGLASYSRLTFDGIGLLRLGTSAFPTEGLWRLEGTQWRQLPLQHPPVRTLQAVASSPSIAGVWMFGGRINNTTHLNDLWRFDGDWTAVSTTNGPSPRRDAAMAWSPVDQAFLLYGGRDAQTTNFDDTWLWNGATWQQRSPSTSPGELLRLATDPSGGVAGIAAYAGSTALLWQWNGSDWSSSPAPSAFAWSSNDVAHDPVRNVLVAVASHGLAEWDGTAWTQGPSTYQYSSRLAYRPDTGRMLLSDGSTTLEWDGANLTPIVGGAAIAFTVAAPEYAAGRPWSFRAPNTFSSVAAASYLTTTPHRAERIAYGCSLAETPGLLGDGIPRPGNLAFGIAAETFAPTAPTVVALGFSLQGSQIGGGCVAWLQDPPAVHFRIADATGRSRVALPIPNAPNLLGVALLAQAGAVDPAHSPIGSIVVSDVLRITLGD